MKKNFVIAIDGPAGVGKSTTARRVAYQLGVAYIDSGAFYRAFTLQLLRHGVQPDDEKAVKELLRNTRILSISSKDGTHIHLDGRDVTQEIRSHEVTESVSQASEFSAVRDYVTSQLRLLAAKSSAVVEGRDIGTAVFPNADLKVFLAASVDERARRRHLELAQAGVESNLAAIRA
ncbi:(d)CMP kinase, partial [bacterium]|nr:(d)CMP kinase [bacterium]